MVFLSAAAGDANKLFPIKSVEWMTIYKTVNGFYMCIFGTLYIAYKNVTTTNIKILKINRNVSRFLFWNNLIKILND